MNITRYNYKRSLPLIVQSFKQSDFISFDFEFSGLNFHPDLANHQTDTMAFRYWKYRENIKKFIPTQMGLCGFKYDAVTERLECYPFNIYLLPYSFDNIKGLDKKFSVSINSFQFLAKNKFDFNRLFYESVGYLSHEEYNHYKRETALKSKQSSLVSVTGHDSPDSVIYCNSQFTTIKAWLD